MKLPYRKNCYIPKEKITKYLLSQTHFHGESKANFFALVGFKKGDNEVLKQEIINLAQKNEVGRIMFSKFGTKYVVKGMIKTPSGRMISITTVWMIDYGKKAPRFITAYPLKRKLYTRSVIIKS